MQDDDETRAKITEIDFELDAKEGLLEEGPTPPSPLFPSSGDDGLVNSRWHNKAILHCYILNGVRDCLPRATPASAHNEDLCRDPMERTCPKKMKNLKDLKDAGKSDNTIVQARPHPSSR
ncbi:hypothetical protein BDZ90DRAFT_87918 [Jaminaea rosea]|uniref:Uncharacterized protein n=1 Tax=Jaminaea rosea TaxID=1569628 RepID=A0A316UI29_9BASI|nr:hypothetical protein BDZ90DRAFT_87918 [Jaminaea rosea]PWN24880.1 hypothetical protein BDZ90DRAFT_87918 [Jaminaea rosea]